ncbi:MAG: hypothetical protein ABIT71_23545 [Vicinamibacteraceae bacterium]
MTSPTSPSAPTQRALLQEAYRDRFGLLRRHIDGATRMADYEFNNTYQYVIGREEIHVQWLRDALLDLGAEVPAEPSALVVPEGKGVPGERAILEDDLRLGRAFVDKWRARLADVRNARHRRLLDLILGEVVEQTNFFQLALAGRDDLLGTRMPGASTGDGVLPVRWMT